MIDATPGPPARPPSRSMEALLLAAADGSSSAFAELYEHIAPAVYGTAKRILVNPALAEEAAHDALLDVWRTCRSFDPSRGSARGWVLTIAHRRAVDTVRHEQAARSRADRAAVGMRDEIGDVVSKTAMDNVGDIALQRALTMLTEIQREAIDLAYYRGFTHREVAAVLGVPLGTAKTRIRDGLQQLRMQLPAY